MKKLSKTKVAAIAAILAALLGAPAIGKIVALLDQVSVLLSPSA